jgi:hypothetical protein
MHVADQRLRPFAHALYYLAILIASCVVARVTDHITVQYIYQEY